MVDSIIKELADSLQSNINYKPVDKCPENVSKNGQEYNDIMDKKQQE